MKCQKEHIHYIKWYEANHIQIDRHCVRKIRDKNRIRFFPQISFFFVLCCFVFVFSSPVLYDKLIGELMELNKMNEMERKEWRELKRQMNMKRRSKNRMKYQHFDHVVVVWPPIARSPTRQLLKFKRRIGLTGSTKIYFHVN